MISLKYDLLTMLLFIVAFHIYNKKIKVMCIHATILDPPTRIKPEKSAQVDNCWIYWKGSMTSISKGSTTSTHDLHIILLLTTRQTIFRLVNDEVFMTFAFGGAILKS